MRKLCSLEICLIRKNASAAVGDVAEGSEEEP